MFFKFSSYFFNVSFSSFSYWLSFFSNVFYISNVSSFETNGTGGTLFPLGDIIDSVKLLGFTILLSPPCVPNMKLLDWLFTNELLAINDFLTFFT